jgi:hypothetical protein
MAFSLRRRSLLAGLLAVACYSPTLPLPPPGEPEVSAVQGKPGYYRLVGQVEPRGEVFARNHQTNLNFGQKTGSSGGYDFEVQGQEGDEMDIWYRVGNDMSPRVVFVLPPAEFDPGGTAGAGGAP